MDKQWAKSEGIRNWYKIPVLKSQRKELNWSLNVTMDLIIIIFSGSAAERGLWPPRSRRFLITHNDVPQSVGLLWTSDHLVAETSTWQHTQQTYTLDRAATGTGYDGSDTSQKLIKLTVVPSDGALEYILCNTLFP
jgi:hypothetical protein